MYAIRSYYVSVIRISGKEKESLVNLASNILDSWRAYTDETVGRITSYNVCYTKLLRLLQFL